MNAGCTIKSIPKNPRKTADHLLIPTLSDKKIIDAIVTNIGPPNVNDTTRTFYERLLHEIDLLFFSNFKLIFSNQYYLYEQRKVLKTKQPYFSRLEFEKLFAKLPFGYDTFLYQL